MNKKLIPVAVVLLAAFILTACGTGLSGRYVCSNYEGLGTAILKFKSNGELEFSFMGYTVDGVYERSGEKYILEISGYDTLEATPDKNGLYVESVLGGLFTDEESYFFEKK